MMSSYIQKFQVHIEKCHNNFIINLNLKNNYLNQLNECIKQLNLTYNTSLLLVDKMIPHTIKTILDKKNIDFKSTHSFLQLYDTNMRKHNKINYPYDNIVTLLVNKVAGQIGFPTIIDALFLIIGPNYKYFFDKNTNNLITFYNSIFTPLGYVSKEVFNNSQQITVESIDIDNFFILHNCANVHIKFNNVTITLAGYFTFDSLNIIMRTSEICNKKLFGKKKKIEELMLVNKNINNDFGKAHLRNASICDLIVLTEQEYINKIISDYNMYNNFISLSLNEVMKEFIKDSMGPKKCLVNMYNIIKLLLSNNGCGLNIAEFLFSTIEEKQMNTGVLSPSEIIYKNLNHFLQLKLKKTSQNISLEIGKLSGHNDENLAKQVIISKNMPNDVKKLAMEKIEEIKGATDHYKQLLFVKILLNYPWTAVSDPISAAVSEKIFPHINERNGREFLDNIITELDKKVCGHRECKDKIKELVGKWIVNPHGNGSVIGLRGPPGVGKTLIAKAIGSVLNFPFGQINLGGQNDGELLHGHGYSYSSAQPGMIVKKMVEAGSPRCIMFFDELDKTCIRNSNNEISNILLHITDPMSNSEFQDRFFQGINFPLNKVLFIFSYNSTENIDKILLDRIDEIKVGAFKLNDKKLVVRQFIIKEMCDMICLDCNMVVFDDKIIEFIVENYTNEPGIRQLKRKFEKIFLKLNIDKIYGINIYGDSNGLITITKEYVELCLGNTVVDIQRIHDKDMVGVINGLYATDSGCGGVLPIQIYENFVNENNNSFTIKLTGSQKRVMRESVRCALTVALNVVRSDIRDNYMRCNKCGFHIHVPSGAVNKDGPSGGTAFTVAFVSLILKKKIRNDVAITGEIDLSGNVSKIGGLEYKLVGAKKAGVKTVLVPKENGDDVKKIMSEFSDLFVGFNVVLVGNLGEVLEWVFVDYDKGDFVV